MRALSIRHPWAELILTGRKTLEIRSWKSDYRGTLLIHAAVNFDCRAMREFDLRRSDLMSASMIGSVNLDDIESIRDADHWEQLRRRHLVNLPYDERFKYAFHLSDAKRRPPQRYVGQSFIFETTLGK